MKKRKKNEVNTIENDDFLAQEAQESQETAEDYTLDIPDDEIWTYQIEGLQKPHINEPFENATLKKNNSSNHSAYCNRNCHFPFGSCGTFR